MQSSTSIDDTFSPPEMITSFLRSAIVEVVLVVDGAAVAGVEPAVVEGVGGLPRAVPSSPSITTLLAREHLALVVDREPHAERRRAGPAEPLRALRAA